MAVLDTHAPKVFISYSHDSLEHANSVRELSDRLRADGIDCILDQYEVLPPEGWPRWTDKQIRDADFVLMICTATYYRRVMGEEKPGAGLGDRWEGHLIYQYIYSPGTINKKFIPVLLESSEIDDIPTPLQGAPYYRANIEEGYEELYRYLTNQPRHLKQSLGKLQKLPSLQPKQNFFATSLTNLPYERNPFFTGREEILNTLRAALTKTGKTASAQAITGLGGIGKTQTAIEYAYRYSDSYKAVFWVRSDSSLALTTGFVEIARMLNLPEKDAENPSDIVEAVKRWLENNSGWLLIFDNADEPKLLNEFRPRNSKGHILLTSRAQVFDNLGIVKPIQMEAMLTSEALAFLFTRTGRDDSNPVEREAAIQLAEGVGYLPLALEQAAAFITASNARFQDFVASFRRRHLKLLKESGPVAGDYPESVATTWTMNFQEVEKLSKAASDLLRISAFLSPDSIPLELIAKGRTELGSALSKALVGVDDDPLVLNRIVEPLTRYSLIRFDSESQVYSIHRLVQEVLKDGMDEATRRLWAERVVRALNKVFPTVDYAQWPVCERLLPHAKTSAKLIEEYEFAFEEAGRLLNEAAFYLIDRGQHAEAEEFLKQSLAIWENVLGPDHPSVATSLNNLAELYRAQGRYTDAEPLYKRALALKEQALSPDHPSVATSLNNLAELYRAQGRYTDAEPLYKRALAISEKSLGSDNPSVATSLNNLAVLYRGQGKYSEAESLHKRAIEIDERVLGAEHPALATDLSNLAGLMQATGRLEEAESLFRRSLEIFQKTLGLSHPKITVALNNLAGVLQASGRFNEAEPLYRHSLSIDESIFGPDHPNVAADLNNLASLLFKMGRMEESESLYRRALKIDEASLQADHPNIGIHLNNLASLILATNRSDEAEALLHRSVEILEKSVGYNHPLTKEVRKNLEAVQ